MHGMQAGCWQAWGLQVIHRYDKGLAVWLRDLDWPLSDPVCHALLIAA